MVENRESAPSHWLTQTNASVILLGEIVKVSPVQHVQSQTRDTCQLLLGCELARERLAMALPDILEARTDEGQPKTSSGIPPVDKGLLNVDTCLDVGLVSLKFDIAELWRFGCDNSKRGSSGKTRGGVGSAGVGIGGGSGTGKANLKPYCEHVYTMPATLKTYTGRIAGMWTSGFDDSRAPQHHVLSPQVCWEILRQKQGGGCIMSMVLMYYTLVGMSLYLFMSFMSLQVLREMASAVIQTLYFCLR